MNTIKEIRTTDNTMSASRCIDYIGVPITDGNGNLLQGEKILDDGTICRFRDGFLDGNVYGDDGEIIERRAAVEYQLGGAEYWEKGVPQGFPAITQNFSHYEEDWDKGSVVAIRTETTIDGIEQGEFK